MSVDVMLIAAPSCPHCGKGVGEPDSVFSANITHNLTRMAAEAGCYEAVWCPDENGFRTASDIAPKIRAAVEAMRADPQRFEAFNAKNGWGLYKHFLPWLERYLEACEKWPDAIVRVWR